MANGRFLGSLSLEEERRRQRLASQTSPFLGLGAGQTQAASAARERHLAGGVNAPQLTVSERNQRFLGREGRTPLEQQRGTQRIAELSAEFTDPAKFDAMGKFFSSRENARAQIESSKEIGAAGTRQEEIRAKAGLQGKQLDVLSKYQETRARIAESKAGTERALAVAKVGASAQRDVAVYGAMKDLAMKNIDAKMQVAMNSGNKEEVNRLAQRMEAFADFSTGMDKLAIMGDTEGLNGFISALLPQFLTPEQQAQFTEGTAGQTGAVGEPGQEAAEEAFQGIDVPTGLEINAVKGVEENVGSGFTSRPSEAFTPEGTFDELVENRPGNTPNTVTTESERARAIKEARATLEVFKKLPADQKPKWENDDLVIWAQTIMAEHKKRIQQRAQRGFNEASLLTGF